MLCWKAQRESSVRCCCLVGVKKEETAFSITLCATYNSPCCIGGRTNKGVLPLFGKVPKMDNYSIRKQQCDSVVHII